MAVISKEEGVTYSDLSGRYPINSALVNQYILICYDCDSNTTLEEAFPSRSAACINKWVQNILATLTTAGHKPKLHIIENEACDILNKTLLKKSISYQLFPPHIHRRNAAGRIHPDFKYHFIAGL